MSTFSRTNRRIHRKNRISCCRYRYSPVLNAFYQVSRVAVTYITRRSNAIRRSCCPCGGDGSGIGQSNISECFRGQIGRAVCIGVHPSPENECPTADGIYRRSTGGIARSDCDAELLASDARKIISGIRWGCEQQTHEKSKQVSHISDREANPDNST
jgi:hypothetical protein